MATNIQWIIFDVSKALSAQGITANITRSFRGRVGDSEADVFIQFMDSGVAVNMNGRHVVLKGGTLLEAQSDNPNTEPNYPEENPTKSIVDYGTTNVISAINGQVKFTFSPEVFAVPGIFKGFFEIVNDDDGKVVSSADVYFRILENWVDMNVDLEPYRSDWQQFMDECRTSVDYTNALNQITTLKGMVTNGQADVATLTQMIKDNQVGKLPGNNEWTGTNTFDEDTFFSKDVKTRDGFISALWGIVNGIKVDAHWTTNGFSFTGGWGQADAGWDHQMKMINAKIGSFHLTFVQGALKPQGDAGTWYSKPAFRLPSNAYFDKGSVIGASTGQANGQALGYSLDTLTGDVSIVSGGNNITAGSYTIVSFIIMSTETYE
ncbi:BppU family phage baseplate upper protein [Furfurilactobacillus milii]|uniref:Phage baseplate upper protein n=1 Tax=Furfurilactobacillus milii TaxID=2888272 RepID=A0ABT6DCC3_9LACO|nr:BppU family phage baseplate upper protein [Furfurilactobacillus milii]QLE66916.1 Hypothetical protein LROSL2_1566 [Furfurilactobacillus rossiae]MCF6161926.1 phage baseplate upper protein [Furfurilactobacillus milii]MCF6164306.1 phage baseplate upper protein [Furfurilactobacillus milii]MDF9914794.1 phage baseplate upper protein [Furfurilactobacillus milii]QLE69346.1 Hypothetical protein LROSL3_1567 [Furfurilactobacillus rossiae]